MNADSILKGYYQGLFKLYGKDEKSLGWTKNKQEIRFGELMKHISIKNDKKNRIALLDLGCGFGDLNKYIKNGGYNIDYWGLDIMPEFINMARKLNEDVGDHFFCTDFIKFISHGLTWDWIVESGFFGHKLYDCEEDSYQYIRNVIQKSLSLCTSGICFDFLSDKVDYRTSENDFHANPAKVLEIAYEFSRNVMLDNSIMPFEFTLTIWKDDTFDHRTIFNDFNV